MADATPIVDPLTDGPPAGIMGRPVFVQPNKLNTVRLMHDPKVTDQARWFATGASAHRVTAGNKVEYLIRGGQTFKEMVAAIQYATASGTGTGTVPFIYICGWGMANIDAPLIPGDASTSIRALLTSAANAGVEVRVMLWANIKGVNFDVTTAATADQIRFVNTLPGARGILDNKTDIWGSITYDPPPITAGFPDPSAQTIQYIVRSGSHHQKIVLVNGGAGLVGFCGGVDLSEDRLDTATQPGLQDVHVSVRGPAAKDLLTVFVQRWEDYLTQPDMAPAIIGSRTDLQHDALRPNVSAAELQARNTLSGKNAQAATSPFPPPTGLTYDQVAPPIFVQIGRTYPKNLYVFAPNGEQTVKQMIVQAIGQAQQFIYMEEQYLVNMDASNALKAAIAKDTFRHLIVLIPGDDIGTGIDHELYGQAPHRRAQFIQNLTNAPGGNKVHVFVRTNRYVHSKIYIVDDRFALVGSANCNRRGWEHDSEVIAGMTDQSSDSHAAHHFAHRMRLRLWADHLGLSGTPSNPIQPFGTDADFSELTDGLASAAQWINLPQTAQVTPYTVNDDVARAQTRVSDAESGLFKGGQFEGLASRIISANINTSVDTLWNQAIDPGETLGP
jgi:phosphatidylserine/phosphatidylglycerophosphate/cardiolipin synthase-like enzyme